MDIEKSLAISASALHAESLRMRIIAENIANAESVATAPGVDPYRRKIATFTNVLDRALGATVVRVNRIGQDQSAFGRKYLPGHPAADASGYVTTPNVNSVYEVTDMREAQRSYEANLSAIDAAKQLQQRTLDLLR